MEDYEIWFKLAAIIATIAGMLFVAAAFSNYEKKNKYEIKSIAIKESETISRYDGTNKDDCINENIADIGARIRHDSQKFHVFLWGGFSLMTSAIFFWIVGVLFYKLELEISFVGILAMLIAVFLTNMMGYPLVLKFLRKILKGDIDLKLGSLVTS